MQNGGFPLLYGLMKSFNFVAIIITKNDKTMQKLHCLIGRLVASTTNPVGAHKRNLMNICISVFLVWASILSLSAQQTTKERAIVKATQFLNNSNNYHVKKRASNKEVKLSLANHCEEFYVFNDVANGGFVIISGDERFPDVLGYSNKGQYKEDKIPCNMKVWLEEYAKQIAYLREHPNTQTNHLTIVERTNISPLLSCNFDQGSPYNNKCPVVNGEHCYTGCVATAMAQVMHYYQWPKKTVNVIPAYTSWTNQIDMPSIPITTIDWGSMLDTYQSGDVANYSDEQVEAISTLMLICGSALEMNYTTTQSGASTRDVVKVLRHFFNYSDILGLVERDGFNVEEWTQLLYYELEKGRPLLYKGGSHAFIIDGYQNGYFHVNWGWNGTSDGYFLLTDLNGFNKDQGAVIGIQPESDDNLNIYAVLDDGKMTLYYDEQRSHRSGLVLPHKEEWVNHASEISECIIDPSMANLKLNTFAYFFSGLYRMKSIQGIKNLDTSNVTDMIDAFYNCYSLTSLDLSGFKTDRVTDMAGMFDNCYRLTSLDVSGFKTDNVKYMHYMFSGCSGLTSLDVSNFKTENVSAMWGMFGGCSSLTNLNLSNFRTDKVEAMDNMFSDCSSLTNLDLCSFKTEKVLNVNGMFSGCTSLSTIYVSEDWNMSNVESSEKMFYQCVNLVGGVGTMYNPDHVNVDYAHIDEGTSNPGYFTYKKSPTNMIKVTKTNDMRFSLYNLSGKRLVSPQKGLNIIRMSDGTTRKVIIR